LLLRKTINTFSKHQTNTSLSVYINKLAPLLERFFDERILILRF
jgi:hypothetical protein